MTPATETEPVLRDGHGNRLYKVREDVAALHRDAVGVGWEHTYELTAYKNLRALAELVERGHLDADRRLLDRFAFKFICGYGPNTTHRALDRLEVTE
jgi:hypothetical protein